MDLLKVGQRDTSYSGKESHTYVDRMLASEKNLMIVSPYIDEYYAKYIAGHSRGKKIKILSSSMQGGAARILKGRNLRPAATFAAMMAFFNILFLIMGIQFIAFALITCSAAAIYLALSFRGHKGMSVRVPKDFVHAKMYIGDNVAIEGSANLTYAGMHENVEHIDVIFDKKRIDELRRQFADLWESA